MIEKIIGRLIKWLVGLWSKNIAKKAVAEERRKVIVEDIARAEDIHEKAEAARRVNIGGNVDDELRKRHQLRERSDG